MRSTLLGILVLYTVALPSQGRSRTAWLQQREATTQRRFSSYDHWLNEGILLHCSAFGQYRHGEGRVAGPRSSCVLV